MYEQGERPSQEATVESIKKRGFLWTYWDIASRHTQEYRETDEWRYGKLLEPSNESYIKATYRYHWAIY